jgi:hypothetical protein
MVNNKGCWLYCEISDRVFLLWTEQQRSEVNAKNWGLIFHSTDQTSEVNNLFIMWLNNFIIWLFKILYSDWLRSGPEKTHIQTVVSIFRIWTSVPDGSFSNETLVYCSALHMMFIDFYSNKIAFSFFWTIIVFRCLQKY